MFYNLKPSGTKYSRRTMFMIICLVGALISVSFYYHQIIYTQATNPVINVEQQVNLPDIHYVGMMQLAQNKIALVTIEGKLRAITVGSLIQAAVVISIQSQHIQLKAANQIIKIRRYHEV